MTRERTDGHAERYILEVDRYGFFMADADADFLQNQDSRWPIYDADFFFFADMFGWFSFFPPSDKI